MVQPIGPLMIEHRLIERMIAIMEKEARRIEKEKTVDPNFLDTAVDFIRVYADRCHHGKEEEILFRDLKYKKMKDKDERVMHELIDEHKWGRETTQNLVKAKQSYIAGNKEAVHSILDMMKQLVDFYPKHIEKEDKVFFKAAMRYLTKEEQDAMLQEEYEFDMRFVHELYKDTVVELEGTSQR